jgi:hypothetical protein
LILKFLQINQENIDEYNHYKVVPKLLDHAEKSLKRYNHDPYPYNDENVQKLYIQAMEMLYKILLPVCGDSKQLSYDEVLSNLRPLKSSGYPLNLLYPLKMDYWLSDDAQFYDIYWERLRTENYIRSLCNVSIKEEMRESKKVDEGSVRTIIAMDVNHVVAHSSLCMYQNMAIRDHLYRTPFMIGLNLLNGGARRLCEYMTPIGWNKPCVLELDGKKFDGRCKYDPHFKSIGNMRWRFLAPEFRTEDNRQRMKNLYYELSHSPLVNVDGHVYCRYSGNPSGQACTTCDNSFKNWCDIYVLWCLSVPVELANLDSFTYYTRVIIVGDDVSIAVHPDVQQWFNRSSIEHYAPLIQMEYHFAHDDFKWFEETTFLGHSFVMNHHPANFQMIYPSIDSSKMRASLLHFNEEGTTAMTIIRTCALRNETFANLKDREWFEKVIRFLRKETSDDLTQEVALAWKCYLTDNELHELYSGVSINGDILVESECDKFTTISLDECVFHPPMLYSTILGQISRASIDSKVHVMCETGLAL